MRKFMLIAFLIPGIAFGASLSVDSNGNVINSTPTNFPTGKLKVNGVEVTSGVSSVTGTAPIISSGGSTPAISITAASTIAAGSMSAADKLKLDGIVAFGDSRWASISHFHDWSDFTLSDGGQVIDLGALGTTAAEGLVIGNDTAATGGVPVQNAPLLVFEAHAFTGGIDHKWEMNEKFTASSGVGGGSKFTWQFADNSPTYVDKSYIDSNGHGAFAGTVYAVESFAIASSINFGFTTIAQFNKDLVSLSSATAKIENVNTTVPLIFQTANSTASGFRFDGALTGSSGLTSGSLVESVVAAAGFTGSYWKAGTSSNGSTITATLYDFPANGNLTTQTLYVPAVPFSSALAGRPEGTVQSFNDSCTETWGDVITGECNKHVMGRWNGTVWTVFAK